MNDHNVRCTFCGSSSTNLRFDFGEAKILRCSTCKVSFTYPKPTLDDLSEVYDENYFSNSNFLEGDVSTTYGYSDYESIKKNNESENFQIAREIGSLLDGGLQSQTLLDIGCGLGAFLTAASGIGFRVEGVEFNEYAAEKVRHDYGYPVYGENEFDQLVSSGKKYDVIVLFDVIEHLLDPIKTIMQIHSLLVDTGLLLIGTTDFNHIIPRILGPNFEDFRRIREHIFFFGKKDLIGTIEMNGFSHIMSRSQNISLKASDLSERLLSAKVPGAFLLRRISSNKFVEDLNLPINFGMKYIAYFQKLTPAISVDEYPVRIPKEIWINVVIPVFNEEKTLEKVIKDVTEFEIPGVKKKVMVIDDGSTDNSRIIVKGLKDRYDIDVFLKPRNEGKGSAVKIGIDHAQGDILIIQDADSEYSPQDYPKLISPILSGDADAVYGSRFLSPERRVMGFWHTLGNKFLTLICNICVNLNVTDMETCYKALKVDVAKELSIKSKRFDIEPEITCKLAHKKMRIYEVPIQYRARSVQDGKKIGIKDAFGAIWAIFKFGIMRAQ